MSVIAAVVKLTLCENKLQHSFQESIIAYSLRICNLENYVSYNALYSSLHRIH